MHTILQHIQSKIYDPLGIKILNFEKETESKEYEACRFQLNGKRILCRNAKITPKKGGQFVTFWKRAEKGTIEPFFETDPVDIFVVNVQNENALGQFVFPKVVLIQKGILSTIHKEGKRAFRVYPSWDTTQNKQAEQTQKWQLDYFYLIDSSIDLKKVMGFFSV